MLWIVIPAKNEAKRISKTLDAYLDFFSQAKIVVAYVASPDETEKILNEYVNKYPQNISYIQVSKVVGNSKGRALRDGFASVCSQIKVDDQVGFVDADNSLAPAEFAKLIVELKDVDVAIASRYLPQSELIDRDSKLRVVASLLFRKLVKILFNLPVVDTQCGGKVFKAEVLCRMLPKLKIDDMVIDVEILYWLKSNKKIITEVPVVWREDQASTISTSFSNFFKTSVKMVYSLFKLKFINH